jgi:hypothetical protein
MYSSTLSLTSALDGGGLSKSRPGRFTPGKETRYTFYRRLGGPQRLSGRVREISPSSGFDQTLLKQCEIEIINILINNVLCIA